MTALLDTNLIVRYLTNDPGDLAAAAAHIIDDVADLLVPEVVLAETALVLSSFYGLSRPVVVDALLDFLRKQNIAPLGVGKTLAIEALNLCRPSGRVSFPDAFTWAHARASGIGTVYSFDGRFPVDGIEVRRTA